MNFLSGKLQKKKKKRKTNNNNNGKIVNTDLSFPLCQRMKYSFASTVLFNCHNMPMKSVPLLLFFTDRKTENRNKLVLQGHTGNIQQM